MKFGVLGGGGWMFLEAIYSRAGAQSLIFEEANRRLLCVLSCYPKLGSAGKQKAALALQRRGA